MNAIGAGSRVYMGTAAAPMNTANGGAGSDADLGDITGSLTTCNLTSNMGSVDITKLNADVNAWSKSFIASLITASISGTYEDGADGAFFKKLFAIRTGVVHVNGRGKVDVKVKVGGATTGYLQLVFTMIVMDVPFDIETEKVLGGTFTGQVDGPVTVSAQP